MSGYKKEKSLFYHLIIWIGWIKVFTPNAEGMETVHEDDGATSPRVSRHTNNTTQERDIDSCRKGKASRIVSSSSNSDDGDNGGNREDGGTSGSSGGGGGTNEGTEGGGVVSGIYVSQADPSMSWA